MAQEVRYLAWRQGFDAAVRLLHTVDQICGKRMPQGVEPLSLDAGSL